MSSKSLNGIYFKSAVLLAGAAAALAVIPAAGPGTWAGTPPRTAGRPGHTRAAVAAPVLRARPVRLTRIPAIPVGTDRARPGRPGRDGAVPAHRGGDTHGHGRPSAAGHARPSAAGHARPSDGRRARPPAGGTVTLAAAAPARGGTPRQIARWLLTRRFHWQNWQFGYLNLLWSLESGWDPYACNPYSGAYGIPQAVPGSKMAAAGADWRSSARTQILWGLGYIRERYGTPERAWQHERAFGWY